MEIWKSCTLKQEKQKNRKSHILKHDKSWTLKPGGKVFTDIQAYKNIGNRGHSNIVSLKSGKNGQCAYYMKCISVNVGK